MLRLLNILGYDCCCFLVTLYFMVLVLVGQPMYSRRVVT